MFENTRLKVVCFFEQYEPFKARLVAKQRVWLQRFRSSEHNWSSKETDRRKESHVSGATDSLLDVSHKFNASSIYQVLGIVRHDRVSSSFELCRKICAALVRNIDRDIHVLGRLKGQTSIQVSSRSIEWWTSQIGVDIRRIPVDFWATARILAIQDLEARVCMKPSGTEHG